MNEGISKQGNTGDMNKVKAQQAFPLKAISLVYIFVGILLLISAPIAMSTPGSAFNGLVIVVNSVFAIILIAGGIIDFNVRKLSTAKQLSGTISRNIMYVMLLLGIVTTFLYSHFYGTPYIQNLHLYIIPISISSSPFHVAYYAARGEISGTSYLGGIMVILGSLYEIYIIRKAAKMHSMKN
ncbi:MAG: hypothetical protein ACYCSO_08145 [Cuniculiplasma sp.]